nr:Chain A, TRP-MET-LEU-ASP-PRO-ILE-ALA-GLY-LYS-TRP-SER-ARG [Escherichia coli]
WMLDPIAGKWSR